MKGEFEYVYGSCGCLKNKLHIFNKIKDAIFSIIVLLNASKFHHLAVDLGFLKIYYYGCIISSYKKEQSKLPKILLFINSLPHFFSF